MILRLALLLVLLSISCSAQQQTRVLSSQVVPIGQEVSISLVSPWRNVPLQYQFALSFGRSPGQIIQNMWIPLNRDSLFLWSLAMSNTPLFTTAHGLLRPNGSAIAQLHVPNHPALRGLKYSVAAILYSSGKIVDVSTAWDTHII